MEEPADANIALAKSLENLHATIEESQAIVTSDWLPLLAVRAIHLVEVFQNLISNAIKYRSDEAPRIHIAAEIRGAECIFSVADNGIGISAEYHQRIFGVFKRLHGRNKYPGSGIGLAICKRVVERYGGRLWVNSESNRGSTFFFCLPICPTDSYSRPRA
jgi:light-regulated signal transduction histidine kinase (bacteriophytochrome)